MDLSSTDVVADVASLDADGGPHPLVDPFLVEALQNPRHRLTVLRMELDIQRFMRNPDQQQFEFQHFPTSYLRAAAHRVAQHYGLQTMVTDIMLDGSGKIIARKTPECRFPAVLLSSIPPAKEIENDKSEQVKIFIRPRPDKSSQNGAELGNKLSPVRTMEERKEDYERARARIFDNSGSPALKGSPSQPAADRRNLSPQMDEINHPRNPSEGFDKGVAKDGACMVAIFRDREKDRIDPDYDRSYGRYLRSTAPNQNFNLNPYFAMQPPPFVQYKVGFPHQPLMSTTQPSAGFGMSDHALSPNPYASIGCNPNGREAMYVPWPSPSMIYAHSYEHVRQAGFQVPFYPQPLSFENTSNP